MTVFDRSELSEEGWAEKQKIMTARSTAGRNAIRFVVFLLFIGVIIAVFAEFAHCTLPEVADIMQLRCG